MIKTESSNILYSLTARVQTQTWRIETKDNAYRTIEGLVDGVLTTSKWTICEGKNLGKANETTGKEQASKEAAAKYKKKLEAGYHESIIDIPKSKFFEPMLAKKWEDYEEEIEFPVYSQPKLDGLRCIVTKDGMFSRNGKKIVSAPHILEILTNFFIENPDAVLDGELYCHKFKHDFNKIISLAKKTKPTEEDLGESKKHIQYWIYDMGNTKKIFSERSIWLLMNLPTLTKNHEIQYVATDPVANREDLDNLYSKYLDDGFEGQMVRLDEVYENKCTKSLLKRKTFQDEEFEIIGLETGRGGSANHIARAILKTKEGLEFEAGMIGSHQYCTELLKNKDKVIGTKGTVIFQNLTPDGIPRFGKLKIIRDYE